MSETNSEFIPPVGLVCHEDECDLDADNIDQNEKVFELTIPSFAALVSEDANERVHILKVEEKRMEEKEETDGYDVVVITAAQLHSTKPELRFCAGSNPAHGVSEIRDGEDL